MEEVTTIERDRDAITNPQDGSTGLKEKATMPTVAVIGAGQMGAGIAQTSAQFGYHVLLTDVDLAIAENAKHRIGKALQRLVSRERMTSGDAEALLSRITPIGEYAGMADADFIIEAATEREEIKLKIIEAAGKVLGPDAIMASNTSSIPITRMGAKSVDPQRFIGMHFFNPVPVMGLIEVIPGLATSKNTLERARGFAESLGKEVVIAGDDPGFVVHRILVPAWARSRTSTRAAASASTIRWGPWSWPTSSGSTRCSRSSRCSTTPPETPSTGPRRCW
jgi:3-hydroxyacyl-CoA dehydrogenase